MLDLAELRRRCAQGEPFEYLFFWGHQPSSDGKITASCLSQWYGAAFEIGGIVYPTAEHWMMAAKARVFSDDESLSRILQAPDPKTAKTLGRAVKNFDGKIWS